MMNKGNPFQFGSMAYLNFEASKVPDILYLIQPDIMSNDFCLKIVCRPGYNIDSILEFVNNHLPIHLSSEVITLKEIKEIPEDKKKFLEEIKRYDSI